MKTTQREDVSAVLAKAGVCTWSWDADTPERLTVEGARGELPHDLISIISSEDWPILQSRFRAALKEGRPFEASVTVRLAHDVQRDVVLRGGVEAAADTGKYQVSGVCWQTLDAGETTEQTQWTPLAKLSHELRSPLTAIMHLTANIQAGNPPPELSDAIGEIEHNGAFMLRIVEDMLAAFRSGEPEAGGEAEIISSALLIDQLEPLASERAAIKDIGFIAHTHDDFPDCFWAEPVALRRILQNLIDNAIKFTQQGNVSVELSKTGEDVDAQLRFDVVDTGPGIPGDEIKRIFAPFEQGQTGQRNVEGLGLGLALSRQLAHALDGRLEIDSEPGRGSRFRLSIPFKPVSASDLYTMEMAIAAESAADASKRSVLLVEDHPLLSKHTGRELAQLGCRVDIAANAQEALAAVQAGERDIVILDLDLPDMSGYDLCRLLVERDQAGKCRYVAYSGSDDIANRQAAEAAGFHAFFVKPTSARDLLGL